jgi:hypothetical protein
MLTKFVCSQLVRMKIYRAFLLFCNTLLLSTPAFTQNDPEFPKGFIMHVKLHNGAVTNFHRGADLYVGGIQAIPQWGLVPQKLRGGFIAGGFYNNQRVGAQFGPTISFKIKTIDVSPFGSAANIHISADHLWGTDRQKLAGGGFHIELLNKLVLGITAHKDYEFKTWWLQTALGWRISKTKKIREPFNE